MVTLCENCEHCDMGGKETHPARWLCLQHKRLEGLGFVSTTNRGLPPYLYCRDTNGGACKLFKRKAEGQIEIKLKQKEERT